MPETPVTGATMLQRAERVLLAGTAMLALIALLPWPTPLMAPLAAAGMLLAATILLISTFENRLWDRYPALAVACGLVVVGLLGLSDRLPGRLLSPQAGLGLTLLGLFLPVSRAYRGAARLAADLLVLIFGIFVLMMLTARLFAFDEISASHAPPVTLLGYLLFAVIMALHRLQENEQRYVDMVEQSISGFVVRRPDGRLVLVNEAYRRMTGYSREELLQLSARDLVVDQGVLERVRRLEPGQSTHIETFLKRKDGSLLEVEYVTQRLRDGNFQSVLLDVSHRKQLQKQRDESERRYAELVEQAQEGISVRRPSGEFVFVNETFCIMLGYSREELLRLSIYDVVYPEDAETISKVQQLGHGGQLHQQKRMLRKDGTVIHVEVSAKRLRGGDVQSTVQDVTERKLAEQRYRNLVDQAADAIWLRGADGRMLFVNDAGCRLLGYSREELLSSTSGQLIHPTDPQTAASLDALKPLQILRVERIMRHKDGHPVPVEASAHRLADGSVQVISHDISERKRIEEELRHMSQRLGEAQEAERRVIARELHDEVGQALTATRLNLKDLQQQAGDGPLAPRIAASEAVVADLLAKIRQMSLDLHPSVLDDLGLGPALRWCVRTRTVGSELKVTLDLPEQLPRLDDMAEITLFRVFQETLSNVLKHASAAHLDVHLGYADGRLVMTAKDDGKGFDAEVARQRALSGDSLGLLGMQERARLAGGELILESTPGKGAEVRVSLPADAR